MPVLLENQFSVVEIRFQTGYQFYWPSQKFKFQAQLNSLIIYMVSLVAILFDHLMKTFVNTQH